MVGIFLYFVSKKRGGLQVFLKRCLSCFFAHLYLYGSDKMHQGYNPLFSVCFNVNLAKRKDSVSFSIKQARDGPEMSFYCTCLHLHPTIKFFQ